MHRIVSPGQRISDRIMARYVASTLGIPETDEEVRTAELTKTAEAEKVAAADACPKCGVGMQVKADMSRCSGCGYATASKTAAGHSAKDCPCSCHGKSCDCECHGKKASKKASERSILDYIKVAEGEKEYFSKIFPSDYVSELCGEPDSGHAGEAVEYGRVPVDKAVKDKYTARRAGMEDSGCCNVPENHPEPASEPDNGPVEEAGQVTVPENHPEPASEPENGPVEEAGQVEFPAGVDVVKADRWIDRKTMAALCPPCAVEMEQRGIKAVKASTIAKLLAKQAESKGISRKVANKR